MGKAPEDIPPQGQEGPEFVIVQPSAGSQSSLVKLDGHRLKNVIYINLQIEYDGGPVILENVSFINCSFVLQQNDNSSSLAKAVFASTPTSFTAQPS